jgi:hypothetical protein
LPQRANCTKSRHTLVADGVLRVGAGAGASNNRNQMNESAVGLGSNNLP